MSPEELEIYREYAHQLPEGYRGIENRARNVDLAFLADHYRCMLFDGWGTLYVGERPLPGAIETLQWLRDRGTQIRLLTNSSSMGVAELRNQLADQGLLFHPSEVISSGSLFPLLARKLEIRECFHVGRESALPVLDGAEVRPVSQPARPVVVVTSVPPPEALAEQLGTALRLLRQPGALLIALNPDAAAPQPDGSHRPVAGAVAERLRRESGCQVVRIGKPFPLIFQKALESFQPILGAVLMVGDTLGTDIAGAQAAGLDSLLLQQGNSSPQGWRDDTLELGVTPTYTTAGIGLETIA